MNTIEVLGVLMEAMGNGTFVLVVEPTKMLLGECLKTAAVINADLDIPYVMTCAPILGGPEV